MYTRYFAFLGIPLLLTIYRAGLWAQPERWQQRVNYEMFIDMDVQKNQYRGTQRLEYTNNSPDTLYRVFYHLYFNAFQPGSMMDVRNQNIPDPDMRKSRLSALLPEEQGWIKVKKLTYNGKAAPFETVETILEVDLPDPILPNSTAVLEMEWDAQVPIQIRRSGRFNSEGIDYSMTQWYPKLCEYDYQGWHTNPYIGREFYGVWGDYDVKIQIDKNYIVAAGGYLQNPLEVGYGYEPEGATVKRPAGDKLLWHFKAYNVHDFAWAADPDYTHTKITADDGTIMRFFWQKDKGYDEAWEALPAIMNRARTIMNERFGRYPYGEYSFIQGGDGGMEYPMATLITGKRSLPSLVGVSIHEQLHSWYQMILASNESLHAWMDEGFTVYASTVVEEQLAAEGLLGKRKPAPFPFEDTYNNYRMLVRSGKEEPLTTHADHFHTNLAYNLGSYSKGCVFLHQLEYVIGKENLAAGLLRYFDTWKFKHPNPNDFIRVMEKQSGLELDWYKEDFVHTTNYVDYAVDSVGEEGRKSTRVFLRRKGEMAMPLDVLVTYVDGKQELFYAPLESMRGVKPPESDVKRTILPRHRWVEPTYTFVIPQPLSRIASIEIDPTRRLADIEPSDNSWSRSR